jgi:polyvinyl alcohol dehydrogenase (cytochrome)
MRIMMTRVLFGVAAVCAPCLAAAADWPGWGGPSPNNLHAQPGETTLTAGNVGMLAPKWVFTTLGDVGATPTVAGGVVYVTDDGGGLFAIDAATGTAIWSHRISDYTGNSQSVSRSSPAIAGGMIVLTDRTSGTVMAVDRKTGSLIWKSVIETNPYAMLTASPVVYKGVVYAGTASNEEYWVSVLAGYVPSFRGSVAALSLKTGQLIWQTYMVPQGYTGGAVWGSGFPVSPARGTLYVTTGNNYSIPSAVSACLKHADGKAAQIACLDAADYVDSVVALDTASGQVKWGERLQGGDTYTLNCVSSTPAQPCPVPKGKDYDFGSAPNLVSYATGGQVHDFVGAGQKSGTYWALDPDTGATLWARRPGPGGRRGGILWGSSADGAHVFVAENDYARLSYRLGPKGVATTTGGSWAALDSATGHVDWQVAVPGTANGQVAGAESAISVADGIVFGGDTEGNMAALDARTGALLWRYASAGSVACGPAIVDGVVYWGSGDPYGTKAKALYAFSLGGR